MRLLVHDKKCAIDEELREYLELRLRFALSRFQHRIGKVTVHLKDLNGPRGGVDKQCRIAVGLVPNGSVTIEETDADVMRAIAHAAERAGRTVRRELERWRDSRVSGPGMSPREDS